MKIEGIMSIQRTPLRLASAILLVLGLFSGQAMAQTNEWSKTNTFGATTSGRLGFSTLGNPSSRSKTFTPRLIQPPATLKLSLIHI